MEFSKAFDYVLHDLLLAKLAAYGIDDNLILYIQNRKHYVCINNALSEFNKVISGLPPGSIAGSIRFNCFFQISIFTTLLRMPMYITPQMTTR